MVDRFSISACYLEMSFDETTVAHGTGFLYSYRGRIFLVTARHNLTGIHWKDGTNLHPFAARPNYLTFHNWLTARDGKNQYVSSGSFRFAIDVDGKPVWMGGAGNPAPDVAILDLRKLANYPEIFPLEDDRSQFVELFGGDSDYSDFSTVSFLPFEVKVPCVNDAFVGCRPVVGQDLFIVGYPLRFATAGDFPIWKRGSIASEPEENYLHNPMFLIDAITREGLSGAPVIGEFVNPTFDNGGKGTLTRMGSEREFVGLYSGRLGKTDDFSAQLGMVWRRSVIEEIIQENWQE